MNNVLTLPTHRTRETGLTYDQFRAYLFENDITFKLMSKRWLQHMKAEGMPAGEDITGRVRVYPSQAVPWLERRREKRSA